jgi:hypothetical protein
MKICSKCNFDYSAPLEDFFSKKKSSPDGFQSECKSCHNKYVSEHYNNNKDYYKNKAAKRNKPIRLQNLQFVMDYLKEHPCIDCGETDPIVLEFDHIGLKVKAISRLVSDYSSIDKIKKEITQCEVRCANCHKRKTAKQFNYYKDIIV